MGREWRGEHDGASEALHRGNPQQTDRPNLPSPSHSFTLDAVILVSSRRAGERVMASITRFLERKLKLTVNRQKSRLARANEVEFLGFVFRRGKIRWSERSFERFKVRVRRLTSRTWGVSMRYRLRELGRFLRGWMGYFALSEYYRPLPEIDQWIRRRVRMCYWKQWGGREGKPPGYPISEHLRLHVASGTPPNSLPFRTHRLLRQR